MKRRLQIGLILLLSIPLILAGPGESLYSHSQGAVTVLLGATIIDGTGSPPLQDGVVVIRGDRIEIVGRRGDVRYPESARIVDVTGKYIIPGLIDLHVHYDGWMGELFLAHGVTTIKDLGNDVEWMSVISGDIESGRVKGPRIFYVGNGIDAPPPSREHHLGLSDPEAARKAVRLLHQKGASAIKVREKLPAELVRAIVEEAGRLGIPVTGHLSLVDARQAADIGINGLEHASGIVEAVTTRPHVEKPDRNSMEYFIHELKAFSPIDLARAGVLLRHLVEKRVAIIPTLSTHWRMVADEREQYALEDAKYAGDPRLAYVPEHVRGIWATSRMFKIENPGDISRLRTGLGKVRHMLAEFNGLGGTVLAGSDTLISVPGLSLQREVEMLAAGGLTPMQALMSATSRSAEFLGRGRDLGAVTAGGKADIVVLSADPISNISNIRRVEMVFKDGARIDTSYTPGYTVPNPKPQLKRPLWIERQLQASQNESGGGLAVGGEVR